MSRLTIIRGLPGSGKSTFAKERFQGVMHVENDMFWMRNGEYRYSPVHRQECERWAFNTIRKALEHGMDVVTSCVYGSARVVARLVRLAKFYGADVEVYRMTGDYGSVHEIPQEVLDGMRDNFEDYSGEIVIGRDKDAY